MWLVLGHLLVQNPPPTTPLPADVSPLQEEEGFLAGSQSLASCQHKFYPSLAPGEDDATRASGTWLWSGTQNLQMLSPVPCKYLRASWTPSPLSWASSHLGLALQKLFPRAKLQGAMAAADPFLLTKHLFPYPVAAGTPLLGRFLLCFHTLTWIWGFAMAGFHPAARFLGVGANHLDGGCLNIS